MLVAVMIPAICVISLSSVLVFFIQPVMGKALLPLFGGAPAVWTACMLFFQLGLLAGYLYAHLCVRYLPQWMVVRLHLGICLLGVVHSFFLLSPLVISGTSEGATIQPAFAVLYLLAQQIGIQYFALSATTPLIQGLLGSAADNPRIYKLYALSNGFSLLALFAFPILVERYFFQSTQLHIWNIAFCLYCLLSFATFWLLQTGFQNKRNGHPRTEAQIEAKDTGASWLSWFTLAALGCALLLASTNHLCQNIASVPFLWIIPLGLYLLSYTVAFSSEKQGGLFIYGLIFLLGTSLLLFFESRGLPPLFELIVTLNIVLFSGCMICHTELAASKPKTSNLTLFYSVSSLGSVVASALVSFGAPLIFDDYREFPLSLFLCSAVLLLRILRPLILNAKNRTTLLALFVGAFGIPLALVPFGEQPLIATRNFFGVLRVEETLNERGKHSLRKLRHGQVIHGLQFLDIERKHIPTTYYGETSGIGRALQMKLSEEPRHIGGIGLGVGTIASYGRAGDTISFYEINPEVVQLATSYFTFLADSPATIQNYVGDGRLLLRAQAKQGFHLLIVDAFSGDSVPVHLLTKEAFQEYRRHLAPGGILAFHLTNYYLDLVPVVLSGGDAVGLEAYVALDSGKRENAERPTTYVLLLEKNWRETKHAKELDVLLGGMPRVTLQHPEKHLWTDDFSSLLSALKW